jgi:Xaa-Pro aminopeptidase
VKSAAKDRREAYQAVLDSQLQGVRLSQRGASTRAVHEGVRAVLAESGLDEYFTHGTGHGVGIDIHEAPSVGRTSTGRLRVGDVVTVEPGIYRPGEYGIRIEDTLSIDGGAKNLYGYTKELLVL